jgi:chemotaxis methyl-accepting protein methylase
MTAGQVVDDGYDMLAEKITGVTLFQCSSYKDRCIRRRIAVRMRARGAGSFSEYASVLDGDRQEYDRLLDVLTVNVTKFFRNPTTYAALTARIVPRLWDLHREICVWSAGTASGEEAYSLASLFYDHACERGALDRLGDVRITGSDIDRASLLTAARARYDVAAFTDTRPDVMERLFPRVVGDTRTVLAAVRALVRFERRDILRELPPVDSYDLIACRNMIIYLSREAQEELLCSFHRVLRPGGFLVLGRVETLLGEPRRLFACLDARERIYQKA